MSWFERFLPLVERLPTDRLALMRDIIGAIIARRRLPPEAVAHDDLHSALLHACREPRSAGGRAAGRHLGAACDAAVLADE